MQVPARQLEAVTGEPVTMPDPDHLVHLQFRRFAGCPVCNLHLRSVARRHEEIAAAGVREVVVFHSTADDLRPHVAHLPFPVVADPRKRLYREFGVESSPRAVLDPRAWPAIVKGVARSLGEMVRERRPLPRPGGDRLGLPGDFLVAPDGRVVAAKRGVHADDQWSVDELLAHAAAASRDAGVAPA
ncbi:MAG TPA: peroxiredoxin-like family protein [Acidimicrobiales bacterium]